MTYKEKLMEDHPEWDEVQIHKYIDKECPTSRYIYCDCDCDICWNQEVTGTSQTENAHPESELSCDNCIHRTVCKYKKDFIESFELLKKIPEGFEVIIRCKYNL